MDLLNFFKIKREDKHLVWGASIITILLGIRGILVEGLSVFRYPAIWLSFFVMITIIFYAFFWAGKIIRWIYKWIKKK